MSLVVKLIIGGWATWFALIGFYALDESGKLLKIRRRIALLLEPGLNVPEDLQSEGEDLA